jgi:hypothetical protein
MGFERYSQEKVLAETGGSLDKYASAFADKKEITLDDLREMKEQGVTLEQYLGILKSKRGCFFHGSPTKIGLEQGIRPAKEKIFATDEPAVAIMKAIYSNVGVESLNYPYVISERTPMKLEIEGVQPNTIGEKGYIYVINEKEGFQNEPKGSWQYIKKGENEFVQCIEVEKSDFKYPVEIKF